MYIFKHECSVTGPGLLYAGMTIAKYIGFIAFIVIGCPENNFHAFYELIVLGKCHA